jgi:CrcB protein
MQGVLLVGLGGALGAIARYGIGLLALRLFGAGFPWGTLVVNVIGGLAMGVVFTLYHDKRDLSLLLATGVLGGFTTFSAFSLETVRMMERGAFVTAISYVIASVVLSCAALMIGVALTRSAA